MRGEPSKVLGWFRDSRQPRLRDGAKAGEYLKERLGVDYGETTADGMFTLVETECLGACGDAPVCLVDNKRMESFMDNARLDALISELKAKA